MYRGYLARFASPSLLQPGDTKEPIKLEPPNFLIAK